MSESRELVIREAVNQQLVIPVNEIVAELLAASVFADQAEDQATRAVISDEDSFNRGSDLQKIIRKESTTLDDKRKDRKRPIDAAGKRISDLYVTVQKRLDAAFQTIQTKNSTWAIAEENRRRAEAEAEAKRIEEAALAAARATVAIGGTEAVADADAVMDSAVKHIERVQDAAVVRGKGAYGASSGIRTNDVGNVTDIRAFLEAILKDLPADLPLWDIVEFKQAGLNKLAARAWPGAGFSITTTQKVVAR